MTHPLESVVEEICRHIHNPNYVWHPKLDKICENRDHGVTSRVLMSDGTIVTLDPKVFEVDWLIEKNAFIVKRTSGSRTSWFVDDIQRIEAVIPADVRYLSFASYKCLVSNRDFRDFESLICMVRDLSMAVDVEIAEEKRDDGYVLLIVRGFKSELKKVGRPYPYEKGVYLFDPSDPTGQ